VLLGAEFRSVGQIGLLFTSALLVAWPTHADPQSAEHSEEHSAEHSDKNSAGALPASFDADYAAMLSQYTFSVDAKVGTRVDYRGLLSEPRWKQLVAALDAVDPTKLTTRDERLAFWINAYNIFAIDLIVRSYPVESIKDLGSFFSPVWKREAGRIAGRGHSLEEIEHEILRPMGEARIHGAIVCASISCPNLLREPYRAESLNAQLDASMHAWLRRPEKGLRLHRKSRSVQISPIFEWFAEDFDAQGGALAVVTRYAPDADRAWLQSNGSGLEVDYFEYDWGLNE
jgi:hypothetical protein